MQIKKINYFSHLSVFSVIVSMDNKYYIYVYLDQRTPGQWNYKSFNFSYMPFYIGKGSGDRLSTHFRPSSLKEKNLKNSTIKKIFKECGEYPLHYRLVENLTEDEAFAYEIDMIKYFGRKDISTGILCNMTDGGFDRPSKVAVQKSRNERIKKIFQYDLNGNFIKEWESITLAREEHGDTSNQICLSIQRKGTAKGYQWSYEYLGEKIESKEFCKKECKFTNIKQIDSETGKVINIFRNTKEIIKALSLTKNSVNTITKCLNKKLSTAFGYKWEV